MSDPAKTTQTTSAPPADAEGAAPSGRAYAAFEHSWTDRWADTEVAVSYRFAKPSPTHIKRLQSTAARNPAQASRALILDVIHPEDRERFLADADRYPGLVTTMSTALIKAVGLGDLGN